MVGWLGKPADASPPFLTTPAQQGLTSSNENITLLRTTKIFKIVVISPNLNLASVHDS